MPSKMKKFCRYLSFLEQHSDQDRQAFLQLWRLFRRSRGGLQALDELKALADEGSIPLTKVSDAINKFGIDVNKPNPLVA